MTSGHRTLWACSECGCTDVEILRWVLANSGDPGANGDPSNNDATWCPRCEDRDIELKEVTEPDPYVGPAR